MSHKKLSCSVFSKQRRRNIGQKKGKQTQRPETKTLRNQEELCQAGEYAPGGGYRLWVKGDWCVPKVWGLMVKTRGDWVRTRG